LLLLVIQLESFFDEVFKLEISENGHVGLVIDLVLEQLEQELDVLTKVSLCLEKLKSFFCKILDVFENKIYVWSL
jgi:hypothetical protein